MAPRSTGSAAALISGAVLASGFATAALAQGVPDLIFYNAKIVTVDGKFSIAQAAAVAGGKFTAVGTDKQVQALAGPKTVKLDLHGQTVLPGFSDTHNHQLTQGGTLSVAVDLTNIHSIADIAGAITKRASEVKPGEWITGTRGWWEYELKDGRLPNRFDLDKAAPNNPVTIPGPHYTIVNSMALKLAGITKDSKDPQGGEIRKDLKTGEPTGELFDNASRAVSRLVPKESSEDIVKGLLKTIALNNSNGITSIGEPGGSQQDMDIYKSLLAQNKLTMRIDFCYNVDPNEPIEQAKKDIAALGKPGQAFGDGMIRTDEIAETGLDGAELTALLREDFPDRPGYKGMFKVKQAQFNEFSAAVAEAGWRLRPHAVGDAAIDEALTAFDYANSKADITKRRWMIDHDFLLLPDMYPTVKKLGLIMNSQYMHDAQLGGLILVAWHRPLADKMENYKSWLAAGIKFTGGSDGPISYHAQPIYEIYGEVTRDTLWGGKLGADQGITREQAIRSVTSDSPYTTFEENVKGSIEPGKYADFVLLSGDILKVPEAKIKDIKVVATVLGGKTVYGKLQ
jgi:predicted amidohydrolase YtcJ